METCNAKYFFYGIAIAIGIAACMEAKANGYIIHDLGMGYQTIRPQITYQPPQQNRFFDDAVRFSNTMNSMPRFREPEPVYQPRYRGSVGYE